MNKCEVKHESEVNMKHELELEQLDYQFAKIPSKMHLESTVAQIRRQKWVNHSFWFKLI